MFLQDDVEDVAVLGMREGQVYSLSETARKKE
jgi:hypothetical protein